MTKNLLVFFLLIFFFESAQSQVLKGRVIEPTSGDAVAFAKVKQKGGSLSAAADSNGVFSLQVANVSEIVISATDFKTMEFKVPTNLSVIHEFKLEPDAKSVGTVNIKHNRQKEKLRESPVTVESVNAQTIKETPASDFYEGLGHLRGVDVTSASMGFRVVNTRGFNSTSPVRSLQLIDGVDNQAPGLNFSLGNFLGASELDIYTTEIIVGASSAYYGPNAFNGVINMTTKSPWTHQGLSAQIKVGERDLGQVMIRYADSYKNKKGRDVFAWKANLFYLRAYDWVAGNANPTTDSKSGATNLGGYDAVNRYGDEVFGTATNDQVSINSRVNRPGLGAYYRDGYWEKDLVNYNTRNLKTNLVMAYKINENNEIQYGFNFGTGTTVYQGDNRYSLNDILFFQNRLEWIGKKGFLRLYATHEDAGNTYDAVYTAFLMQDYAKKDEFWFSDYTNYWQNYVTSRVKKLPGYPTGNPISNPNFFAQQDAVFAKYRDSLVKWHQESRNASNRDKDYQGMTRIDTMYNRLVPGTEDFNRVKNNITSRNSYARDGAARGSSFFDKSAMYHATGERRFAVKEWKFTTGFSARYYTPYSKGTIFLDTGDNRITNHEVGVYGGIEKRIFKEKLKVNATTRVDKNENFNVLFSPAVSFIYSENKKNTYRASMSSAIRNPTLQDQFLYYNVGRAILLGNKDGVNNVFEVDDFIDFLNTRDTQILSRKFNVPAIKPEQVKTFELGYKGMLYKNRLTVDAGYYYSIYSNFIGYRVVVDANIDSATNFVKSAQAYRVASNSRDVVHTQGFSVGVNYFLWKFYMLSGNWSWNILDRRGSDDPLIPAFNTPRNKFNLGFGASDLTKTISIGSKQVKLKNVGFNINYKWVEGYLFEGSPQFTGFVPTYWQLDAQVSKRVEKWKSTFKLGASNLTNNQVFQVYGGPIIGRMTYFSITYEP